MNQRSLNHQSLPVKLQQMLQKAALPPPQEIFCVNLTPTVLINSLLIVLSCCLFVLALFLTVATWSCESTGDGDVGCNVVVWSLHLWPTNALLDALQLGWCLAFLLALTWLVRHLREEYRRRYLCVYSWGLFYTPNLSFPWECIQKVWRGWKRDRSEIHPPHVGMDAIRLLRDDDKTLNFDRTRWNRHTPQQRHALCEVIEREVVRVHLPALLEQFDRGEWLIFGPLHVSRTGLGTKEQVISWEEVANFEVGETMVSITQREQALNWYFAYVPDLPNVCLLREVARLRELMRTGES